MDATRCILISISMLLAASYVRGQEPTHLVQFPDSISRIPVKPDVMFFDTPAKFAVPPSFQYGLYSFSETQNPYRSIGTVPFSLCLPLDRPQLYIEAMWQSSLERQERYKLLWTILGSMEMGGAAYVAYQHIRKYGLW